MVLGRVVILYTLQNHHPTLRKTNCSVTQKHCVTNLKFVQKRDLPSEILGRKACLHQQGKSIDCKTHILQATHCVFNIV